MTITRGVSFPDYQALPGVNWSTLKAMHVSPLHYRYGITAPRVETDAMRFGRAVHVAVLEPDALPLEVVVWDGGTRRGKEWDAFVAANHDRTILKRPEYLRCLAIRDAVHAHKAASSLLKGQSEISIEWTDADSGIACKARIDHLCDGSMSDLKTTTSVDERDFGNVAGRLLYHGQAAFYAAGLERCDADAFDTPAHLIAVESEPPHDVAAFRVTDAQMHAGRELVRELLYRLAECRERDEWPGRYESEQELFLPPWLLTDDTGLGITIGGETA
jgi:hypothetical protein